VCGLFLSYFQVMIRSVKVIGTRIVYSFNPWKVCGFFTVFYSVILVCTEYTIFYLEIDNWLAHNEKRENQLIQILIWKMTTRLRITIESHSQYRLLLYLAAPFNSTIHLKQRFSNCGTRTTNGTRKTTWCYAKDRMVVKKKLKIQYLTHILI
jgi:hypothetical protein